MAKPVHSRAKRIKANRLNARLSTGPRTSAGKRRVAKNAFRHGLAVPIGALSDLNAQAERLAKLLAGSNPDAERLHRAQRVAEAEIDLIRIQQARTAILSAPMADPAYLETKQLTAKMRATVKAISRRSAIPSMEQFIASVRRRSSRMRSGEAERVNAILGDLSAQLTRLDRYERRALSRRKFAARALDELTLSTRVLAEQSHFA